MKELRRFWYILMVCTLAFGFTSCNDDDDPDTNTSIAGVWIEDSDVSPYRLVLNSNHTGSITCTIDSRAQITLLDEFQWDTDTDAQNNTYLVVIHSEGDVIFPDVMNHYVKAGNKLKLHVNDDYGYATFTRK